MRVYLLVSAVLCASFAAYACSSSDDAVTPSPDGGVSTTPDAGAADAAVDVTEAGPQNRGSIFAVSDSTVVDGGARFQTSAGASFTPNDDGAESSVVSSKTVGPCLVTLYDFAAANGEPDPVPEVSAGTLHFTGGASMVNVVPNADNTYDAVTGTMALWKGGETITVTADGKDVPAFTVSAVAPPKLTLSAPALPASGKNLSITRSAIFSAAWTGGAASGGTVVLSFTAAVPPLAHTARCTFKASDGKGDVPAEVFADFPASEGLWRAYVQQAAVATPVGWSVGFVMSSLTVDPAGVGVEGPVDFK